MGRDRVGPTAEDWMHEAEADRAAASDLTATGHFSRAVFLAGQAVEKALKAGCQAALGEMPPRIHRLRPLAELAFGTAAEEILDSLGVLEPHYVMPSYPTVKLPRPSESYKQSDAEEAVKVCSELLTWIRSRLPESG